jgi:hypothetical protein
MTTEKQIVANRRNALKSTGPRTPEGKTIAAQNSLTHGLLADRLLIYDENPNEFNVFYQSVLRDLAPVGEMEFFLAERIISIMWRLKRAGRMESAIIDDLCVDQNTDDHLAVPARTINLCFAAMHPLASDFDYSLPIPKSSSFGRMARQDFTGSNLITRLLRYEGEMDRCLHKTILELQKFQYIRNRNNANSEGADHATV